MAASQNSRTSSILTRNRISLNEGWKFMRYTASPDNLMYDERPLVTNHNDDVVADTKPTEAIAITPSGQFLKNWILPSANDFIKDPAKHHRRPEGNPGNDFPFVQNNFNDGDWEPVDLPHDWAIKGPFYSGPNPEVGGGMGRLPSHGVAWYRNKFNLTTAEKGKSIYIEIDGAMAYTMVWLNGKLVGGWPYGYNSFSLDLTPHINFGGVNQLAIRIDNPPNSSRWYPGGGIYRNVWLLKVNPFHVAQWGTFIRARDVKTASATIDLDVTVENNSTMDQTAEVITHIYALDTAFNKTGSPTATFSKSFVSVKTGEKKKIANSVTISNPKLWGPIPEQKPNLYVAVTSLMVNGKLVDVYEKEFGIRSLQFDAKKGLLINGIPVKFQGVNQHHDLGALGAAFNIRAAERQLEILQEMGCNAIRISHNPPATELLDLTDRMGMLVI
ncbi:MAG: sugar-binding domain-containing protein, partial [Chitinophagaceae bacterium]